MWSATARRAVDCSPEKNTADNYAFIEIYI